MFTALLDTCILWPSLQRDFLLSLAVEDLYRPVWSSAVLAELEIAEARGLRRRGVPAADADRRAGWLIERMRAAFGDAEVTGWEPLDGSYGLPDRDDGHVVAAAVLAGASAVITDNSATSPPTRSPLRSRSSRPTSLPTKPSRSRPLGQSRPWRPSPHGLGAPVSPLGPSRGSSITSSGSTG